MVIFLDTAFVLSLILVTDETEIARKYFKESTDSFVISISVYEEAFYVGVKLLAEERLNIKGKYDLRDYIKKKGYEFAKDFLERLHKLFELVTLIDDTKNAISVRNVAEKYGLLPNDAVIAATCKHHGINKIATFDSDFKRVDFLEIITLV
ncbi:tRNA(fMet)-specific endonuclease VapC [ANME-1 cluster archaeon GoMg1]|nr:tRNA(fMet)-specific endonuclease VapC [ANME-1 cluster archaeon GoMg1]